MLPTLVLMATLQVAPQQDLKLNNAALSYSALRIPRKDNKVLPGDMLFLCFDIEGLKETAEGKVGYSIGMEMKNKDGKTLFKQEPQKAEALNSLGGGKVPGFARADIGDTPPGEYTMTVTIIDNNDKNKATQALTQKFEVMPKGLGIVSLSMSYDPKNELPAPALGVPGQYVFVNFGVVGYTRDKDKKTHFVCEMRIIDDKGKAILEKPYSGEVKDVPADATLYPAQFLIALNRTGKFKIELKLVDKLTNKEEVQSIDLQVLEAK